MVITRFILRIDPPRAPFLDSTSFCWCKLSLHPSEEKPLETIVIVLTISVVVITRAMVVVIAVAAAVVAAGGRSR